MRFDRSYAFPISVPHYVRFVVAMVFEMQLSICRKSRILKKSSFIEYHDVKNLEL